jgi:hypothetical protein
MPHVWLHGPRWIACFGVQRVPARQIFPDFVPSNRVFLVYSFEQDLRELMCAELRPGVYADWSDAREQLGLR